ncbi:pentatricopeptide repeat-containing protein [Tanacetum coccineum]
MKEKVLTSWNSIIGGLAFHGHSEEAINIFNEMRSLKLRPNDISFVGVLVACSHAGRVQEGREYFRLMKEKYKIEPNVRHFGCMVDLLGRAGLLNEAFEFVDKMEIEPNAIIWRTLLGSCRVHNNVELGRRANDELLKVMDDKGVRKEAASSLVDTDEETLMHFLFDSKPQSSKKRGLIR